LIAFLVRARCGFESLYHGLELPATEIDLSEFEALNNSGVAMKRGFFLLAAAVISSVAYCDLYVPGAGLGAWGENAYAIGSSTLPNGEGDGASIWVVADPLTYLLSIDESWGGTLGIGHEWFLVSDGTVINADFVLNTTPFYSIFDPLNFSGEILMSTQPFMLAFWLDADGPIGDRQPGIGDVFGWAELAYDGTTLTLVDSAAENDGVGIIAGQYQQVPEPATLLLFGLGGAGAWFLRRNKRPQIEE
jgi:hypothetical protein